MSFFKKVIFWTKIKSCVARSFLQNRHRCHVFCSKSWKNENIRVFRTVFRCVFVNFLFPKHRFAIRRTNWNIFYDGFSSEECVFSVAFYNFLFFVKYKKQNVLKQYCFDRNILFSRNSTVFVSFSYVLFHTLRKLMDRVCQFFMKFNYFDIFCPAPLAK